jgi:hypothetical protein
MDKDGEIFIPFLYRSGGISISLTDARPNDQLYSHLDTSNGEWRHYHVLSLHHLAKSKPKFCRRITVELIPEQVEFIRKTGGVERKHLQTLTQQRLQEPGIMVLLSGETCILVDGNHRYVRRYDDGMKTMDFIQIDEIGARQALLDLPPMLKLVAEKSVAEE